MNMLSTLFTRPKLTEDLPSIYDFPTGRYKNDIAVVNGKEWVCTDQRYESYTWSRFDEDSYSIISVGANRYGMLGGRDSQVTKDKAK